MGDLEWWTQKCVYFLDHVDWVSVRMEGVLSQKDKILIDFFQNYPLLLERVDLAQKNKFTKTKQWLGSKENSFTKPKYNLWGGAT